MQPESDAEDSLEGVSNPRAELPVNNAKYVRMCSEMYLGRKGIMFLGNFEGFDNLTDLWINDNEITSITDLDNCIRIRRLYAHNNRIRNLYGSLQFMKFIEVLNLANNNIKDLSTVLQQLSIFRSLSQLDLSGNPVAEETAYRMQVIDKLPQVQVLDCSKVKSVERKKARAYIERKKRRALKGNTRPNATETKSKAKNTVHKLMIQPNPYVDSMSATAIMAEEAMARLERAAKRKNDLERLGKFHARAESQRMEIPASLLSDRASQRDTNLPAGALSTQRVLPAMLELFRKYDTNGNGKLSADELRALVADMVSEGYTLHSEREQSQLETLLAALDTNNDGQISWKEFEDGLQGELRIGGSSSSVRPLLWRAVDRAKASDLAQQSFALLKGLREKAELMDPENEAAVQMHERMLALSAKANRFSMLAQTPVTKTKAKARLNPRKNMYKVFNWQTEAGDADADSSDDDDGVELKRKFGLSGMRPRRNLSGVGKQVIGAQVRKA